MDWSRDLLYACRALRRAPGLTVAAVLTLGLGIGVTTSVLTVANTVLWRPLPYPNADALVRLVDEPSADDAAGRVATTVDADEFRELSTRVQSLSAVGVHVGATATLTGRGDAVPLTLTRMSAAFFPMLGVTPALGRAFAPHEEEANGPTPLVISHGAWQRVFGGTPAVIGREVSLDGQLALVVGVMPASFAFPDASTDAWIPFRPVPIRGRAQRYLVYGALRPNVPLVEASAEVSTVLQDLRGFPTADEYRASSEPLPFALIGWKDDVVGPVRPALHLLAAAAGVVLVLACVNVATLLLARGTARTREIATRVALGASRGRLLRQLFTEGIVLALLGGAVGLALAACGLRALTVWGTTLPRRDLVPGVSIPRLDEVHIDPSALMIAASLVLISALVAGLWPAVRLAVSGSRYGKVWARLTENGTTRRLLAHGALLTIQIALAVALLVGGVLTIRSFAAVVSAELGFAPDRVLTLRLAFPAGRYARESLEAFSHRVVDRLRDVPGVSSAAYAWQLPLVQARAGGVASTEPPAPGAPPPGSDGTTALGSTNAWVHHDFFRAMHMRVLDGRSFTAQDSATQPRVVVVNDAFVRSGLLGATPVGRVLFFGTSTEPWEVVGVVKGVARFGLGAPAEPEVYFDARQRPALPGAPGRGPYVVVQAERNPQELLARLRDALRTVDRDATFVDIAAMSAIVEQASSRPRLYAGLMNVFALSAVMISAWGIVGIVAYIVAQRRREIGIRLTLGATQAQIVRAAVAPLLWRAGLGAAMGLVLASGLVRYLESMLFGVRPLDAISFVTAAGLMLAIASSAAVLTARRATVVDPAETLRAE